MVIWWGGRGQDDFPKQILGPSYVQEIENNIEGSVISIVRIDNIQFKRQDRVAAERNPGMKSHTHIIIKYIH